MLSFISSLFGSSSNKRADEYRVWAQTEFGKDWRYAYEHLLIHDIPPVSYTHLRAHET